jgi:hypothetical protein
MSVPILGIVDSYEDLIVCTDAFKEGFGVVFSQNGHVIVMNQEI